MIANPRIAAALDTRDTAASPWRVLLYAVALTAIVFVVLPLLDNAGRAPAHTLTLRDADTAKPPPLAPPPPRRTTPVPRTTARPRLIPQLETPRLHIPVAITPARLDLGPRAAIGDFDALLPLVAGRPEAAFAAAPGADLLAPAMDLVFDVAETDAAPQPVVRMPPLYPPRARMRRIEGEVLVEFIVTAQGTVTEPLVVQSAPAGVFEQSSLQAIQRWRFQPGIKDGKPVAVRVRQKLTFELEE